MRNLKKKFADKNLEKWHNFESLNSKLKLLI